ncbi:sigma-70 family RNA polymerase sigma factor [Gymnodinialimonas sp. 2305UL16-5]|uniref:RNA polymerase sigma factor n=1 Tax=Gymnodinialimonas mytili TaxID=3126503 RepID=UPI0030B65A28
MSDPFANQVIDLLPNLRRYAISLARKPDVADDLVQITVEKALKQRRQYDPRQKLAPWLLRILRNAWIDETRRQNARGQQSAIEDVASDLVAEREAGPEMRLEVQQTLAAIYALPEGQRDAMVLVCIEGLSYREAAEVMGVAVGTVMSRLARGRLALVAKVGIDRPVATYPPHPTNKTGTPER